jgi:hypothetical protein
MMGRSLTLPGAGMSTAVFEVFVAGGGGGGGGATDGVGGATGFTGFTGDSGTGGSGNTTAQRVRASDGAPQINSEAVSAPAQPECGRRSRDCARSRRAPSPSYSDLVLA